MWEVHIDPSEVFGIQAHFRLTRMVRNADGVRVRLLSTVPPTKDAVSVKPDLEDAYLGAMAA